MIPMTLIGIATTLAAAPIPPSPPARSTSPYRLLASSPQPWRRAEPDDETVDHRDELHRQQKQKNEGCGPAEIEDDQRGKEAGADLDQRAGRRMARLPRRPGQGATP